MRVSSAEKKAELIQFLGSIRENILHFLSETEVVFGLWAAASFLGVASINGSFHDAVGYIEGLNFTEPKFVFVVMVVASLTAIISRSIRPRKTWLRSVV